MDIQDIHGDGYMMYDIIDIPVKTSNYLGWGSYGCHEVAMRRWSHVTVNGEQIGEFLGNIPEKIEPVA